MDCDTQNCPHVGQIATGGHKLCISCSIVRERRIKAAMGGNEDTVGIVIFCALGAAGVLFEIPHISIPSFLAMATVIFYG